MRRALGILSVTMITAGCVIAADVALTLLWKEPVSTIYAKVQQGEAQAQLEDLQRSFVTSLGTGQLDSRAGPGQRARKLGNQFAERIDTGAAIGEIRIPSAGIDYAFVEGTDSSSLERGPGHYPETALPGQGATTAIAGHRTTYGAPFRDIDEIREGDRITLEMPYGTFTYEVEKTRIVEPTDVEIVRDVGRDRLVLTACHPLYSAAERFAVFAELVDVALPATGRGLS